MLSFKDDITVASVRAAIITSLHVLAAQGATVDELVAGVEWARAYGLFADPDADAMLVGILADLRAGRILEARS